MSSPTDPIVIQFKNGRVSVTDPRDIADFDRVFRARYAPRWQPVTANSPPRDGRQFLGYVPEDVDEPIQVCMRFDGAFNSHFRSTSEYGGGDPTHWMPFPDPPTNAA